MPFLLRAFSAALFACIVVVPDRGTAQTHIDHACLANNTATCFVLIEGPITEGLTDRLQSYVENNGPEGNQLYLNSPGGNLGEALRLGRMIREMGWITQIGGSAGMTRTEDGRIATLMWPAYPSAGICESACAYVFMGGVNRYMDPDGKLGFHRFRGAGQQITGDAAQQISGQLIGYIVEMGIDARVFMLASGEDAGSMYHISGDEALDYDVVTPDGYSDFYLEPYGEGIVAASRRQHAVRHYDYVEQITAFCRDGAPTLLFYAGMHNLFDIAPAEMDVRVDGRGYQVPASGVGIRAGAEGAYITVALTGEAAQAIRTGTEVRTGFSFPRVAGGYYPVELSLSEMDRRMLEAAFRFCI